jgi:hypothetical protein
MGPDLKDLAYTMFGSSIGAWYWISNSQSVHPAKGIRWNPAQGTHPFVLIADFDGLSPAVVRGRSTTWRSNFDHSAHPRRHEDTCKIDAPGWIGTMWSLKAEVICRENYSCVEPYEEVLDKLRSGAD